MCHAKSQALYEAACQIMTLKDAMIWAQIAALLGIAISWLAGGYFLLRLGLLRVEEDVPGENFRAFRSCCLVFLLSGIALIAAGNILTKLGN